MPSSSARFTTCDSCVTTLRAGTDRVSHTLPPMIDPAPTTVRPPRIVAFAYTTTSSSSVGCRFTSARDFCTESAPRVTPWYILTRAPITAVSPITIPVPWSIANRGPIRAPGWMSIPVPRCACSEISRGTSGTPSACRVCATR